MAGAGVSSGAYDTPSFVGFSLWLVPPSDSRPEFQRCIDELAAAHGAVPFVPHVTLLGGLSKFTEAQMRERTAKLAAQLAPYELRVDRPAWLSQFFRCVFLLMHKDPAVCAANDLARFVFELSDADEGDYMPHLSLLYSGCSSQQREDAVALVADRFAERRFTVDAIQLWNTTGEHGSWSLVAEYPLTLPSAAS